MSRLEKSRPQLVRPEQPKHEQNSLPVAKRLTAIRNNPTCERKGSRTLTALRPPQFECGASTNSAILPRNPPTLHSGDGL